MGNKKITNINKHTQPAGMIKYLNSLKVSQLYGFFGIITLVGLWLRGIKTIAHVSRKTWKRMHWPFTPFIRNRQHG